MSTVTKQSSGASQKTANTSSEIAVLIDRAISSAPVSVVAQSIEKTLSSHIDKFRATLPRQMKGDAERLVRRAIVYYQTADPKTKLHQCTPQSFVMCVLEAAEIGLPLDGKLCHAVAYGQNATCMPDYKGLIAVAKRTGLISDIYAEIVCENDPFSFERTESTDRMTHSFALFGDRGKVVGCYGKVQLPNGSWRFDILRRSDIDEVRAKSKAINAGPWKIEESSDWKEMAKKTVIKRILKGFADDPGLARAIELDDRATGYAEINRDVRCQEPVDTRPKADRLASRLLETVAVQQPEVVTTTQTVEPTDTNRQHEDYAAFVARINARPNGAEATQIKADIEAAQGDRLTDDEAAELLAMLSREMAE